MWCNLGEKKDLQGRRRGGGTKRKQRNNSSPFFLLPSPFSFIRNEASVFSFFSSRINRRIEDSCRMSRFSLVDGLLVYLFLFFFFYDETRVFFLCTLRKIVCFINPKIDRYFFFYFLFLFGYLSRVVLFRFRDVKGCVRFIWRIINPNSREWDDF